VTAIFAFWYRCMSAGDEHRPATFRFQSAIWLRFVTALYSFLVSLYFTIPNNCHFYASTRLIAYNSDQKRWIDLVELKKRHITFADHMPDSGDPTGRTSPTLCVHVNLGFRVLSLFCFNVADFALMIALPSVSAVCHLKLCSRKQA
jgi:hypothetical protein